MTPKLRGSTAKLGTLSAVVVLLTTGLYTGTASAASGIPKGPITFGVITSESGPLAEYGALIKSEYEGPVNYVNAHGGIDGHQIKLVVLNDAGDPSENLTDARTLLADNVNAVLEPGFDGINTGSNVLFVKAGIPEVWPIEQAAETNAKNYPNMFAIQAGNTQDALGEAEAVHKAGFTKVATINDTTPEGMERETLFLADAQKLGITVTAKEEYSATATNVTPEVAAAQASNPQALVVEVATGIPQLFSSMASLKWYPDTYGDDGLWSGGNTVGAPAAVIAHVYAGCPTYLPPGEKLPAAVKSVTSAMQKAEPDAFAPASAAIGGLDTIDILKSAIEKENSDSHAAIIKGIQTIHSQSFSVPWIKYTFTSSKHVGDTVDPTCGLVTFGEGGLPIPSTHPG